MAGSLHLLLSTCVSFFDSLCIWHLLSLGFFWISFAWLVQTEEGKRGYILPHCHLFPILDAVFFESSFGDHMAFDTEFRRSSGDQIPECDTREVLLSRWYWRKSPSSLIQPRMVWSEKYRSILGPTSGWMRQSDQAVVVAYELLRHCWLTMVDSWSSRGTAWLLEKIQDYPEGHLGLILKCPTLLWGVP